MYHLDCVRSMIWRPKSHFDQPSSLGVLLTSRFLFKPTAQLFLWCHLLKKQRRSCWCVFVLSALLQFRQLWNRTTKIPHSRRKEWWDYFGLTQYIGQHQLSRQGLGRAARLSQVTAGNQLQELAGHLGAGPWGHHCIFLDSRHQYEPDLLKSDKTELASGTECLIHAWCIRNIHEAGDKGQKPPQSLQQAWF